MATRAPTTRKKRVAAPPRAVGSALSADARHALAAIETMNPLRGLTATGAQNLFDAARQGDVGPQQIVAKPGLQRGEGRGQTEQGGAR